MITQQGSQQTPKTYIINPRANEGIAVYEHW